MYNSLLNNFGASYIILSFGIPWGQLVKLFFVCCDYSSIQQIHLTHFLDFHQYCECEKIPDYLIIIMAITLNTCETNEKDQEFLFLPNPVWLYGWFEGMVVAGKSGACLPKSNLLAVRFDSC